MTLRRRTLHDGWLLRPVGGSGSGEVPAPVGAAPVRASVPGCVHTDLLAAGLVPDPYLDENEARLAWIGRVDWRYETEFEHTPDASIVDLVCGGLDTVARLELNGTEIGTTANMHRGYRFDVTHLLTPGTNRLAITFTSALDHAEAQREHYGDLPHTNDHPFNLVRKMACNFGWDWGPVLVTAGIWRPIALEQWRRARLASVRPLVTVDGNTGHAEVHIALQREDDAPVEVRVSLAGQEVATTTSEESTVVTVDVPEPRLWWPRGYGEQHRYPLEVVLSTPEGEELDRWSRQVGFRSVELDTSADEHGTAFRFVVNGKRVFAKGANWIPDDCFPHRVGRDRYARRFTQATDAGVNLLRVWGGGIYESDEFYDLADERGILVWQDFLFACAAYPEEEPLRGEVVAEAREAVTRLAPHPSLVLWNGSNENVWGYHDWGWQPRLGDRTWGLGYYTDVLPKIVAELDPTRPYCPSSPWSFSAERHPNDPDHGCTHLWDVWNQRDYLGYLDYTPRFVSEFGFCGAPTATTLHRALSGDLTPDSPGVIAHNKAANGPAKLAARLAEHFPPPAAFPAWHWATQLNQARAIGLGIRHFRSLAPDCAGTIVWQLNDCWPVISWSVVDGDERLKPAWYALRDSYADRLVTIGRRGDRLVLTAVNDTDRPWQAEPLLRRIGFDGTEHVRSSLALDVPARGMARHEVPLPLAEPDEPAAELLVVDTPDAKRATWFFAPDLELRLPEARYRAEPRPVPGGYEVWVTAETLLLDLTLLADQAAESAVSDEALLTVLPGETVTFGVQAPKAADPAAFAEVLHTANELARRAH
ncbi:beta-mannosidase [Amycolatopsis sacchari]|uniref:beta-mannosidase n=1 Tax=Amycolatopsis sacchari TaxID=115433 RepID=A0A1I3YCJ6_9PSEU|nr:glycoside hydrolase family 2 protein [Amycolatopsis sacchari]SFK29500.1 beta-mannosidase [Amycolatopsis sacchari]